MLISNRGHPREFMTAYCTRLATQCKHSCVCSLSTMRDQTAASFKWTHSSCVWDTWHTDGDDLKGSGPGGDFTCFTPRWTPETRTSTCRSRVRWREVDMGGFEFQARHTPGVEEVLKKKVEISHTSVTNGFFLASEHKYLQHWLYLH